MDDVTHKDGWREDTTAFSAIHDLLTVESPALEALAQADAISAEPSEHTIETPVDERALRDERALHADATILVEACATQVEPVTTEQTLFDQPLPLPPPLRGEPAYLVEVRAPGRPPALLAVRSTLDEAFHVAACVHPAAGDVVVHELALPCDAETLEAAAGRHWARRPCGTWTRG